MFEVIIFLKSFFLKKSNNLGWRNDQNKSHSTRKDLKIVVDNVFIWNNVWYQNAVWSPHNLKFKFSEQPIKSQSYRSQRSIKISSDDFFVWNHLFKGNFVWISHIIKKQNFQTASDGETIQTKVIVLDNI